jgi:hypothetical protein
MDLGGDARAAAIAAVEDKVMEESYGKFGWVMDPEGNRIELWEPPTEARAEPPASKISV